MRTSVHGSKVELKGQLERMQKLLGHARSYKRLGLQIPAQVDGLIHAIEQAVPGDIELALQKAKTVCSMVTGCLRVFVRTQIGFCEGRIETIYGQYDAEIQAKYGQVHQLIAELKFLTKEDVYDHAVVSNKMHVLEDMLNRAAAEEEKRRDSKLIEEIRSLLEQNRKLIAA